MEEPAKSSEKRLDHLGWPSLKEWSHWGVGCTQSENGHAQGNGGCGWRDHGDIWCFIGDCSCPNTEQAGTGGKWPAWGNFHVMRSGRGWRAWWLGRVGNEKWTVVWKRKIIVIGTEPLTIQCNIHFQSSTLYSIWYIKTGCLLPQISWLLFLEWQKYSKVIYMPQYHLILNMAQLDAKDFPVVLFNVLYVSMSVSGLLYYTV